MADDLEASARAAKDADDLPEPPRLRRLRQTVMALLGTMILAVLVVAAALVWRLTRDPVPQIGETVALPAGAELVSAARTREGLMLVIEDRAGGARRLEFRSDGRIVRYRLVREAEE